MEQNIEKTLANEAKKQTVKLEKGINADVKAAVYDAALLYLSKREYAQKELKIKLQKKFTGKATEQLIEQILVQLEEKGWQSDERYMEMLFTSRLNRGYGPLRIVQELVQKGVNKNRAQEFVWDNESVDWFQQIHELKLKKFSGSGNQSGRITDESDRGLSEQVSQNKRHYELLQKNKQKQLRFFQSRGYTSEQIYSVLD